MDFDRNLLYNFTSIIATLLFVITTGITIVRKLKLRWPINVNCWFCNNNTKIYCNQLDWWLCPDCQQYNGFSKDGDYAYEIPDQRRHCTKIFAKSVASKKLNNRKSLCDECNLKEELKLAELRTFESQWFFNLKLQKFKQDLELRYPLCENCQNLVNNVLHKQSQWLTQYKMLFFRQKSIDEIVHNAKKLDTAVRYFLTMLTSVLMCYPSYWPLPFIGAFFQTSAFIINQTHKRTRDAMLTLLWIGISLVGPLKELKLIQNNITQWPSLESITEYQLIIVLALIIGLMNITSRNKNNRNYKASFKKLESSFSKKNELSIGEDSFEDFPTNNDKWDKNYSNYCRTEVDNPMAIEATPFNQHSRKPEVEESSSVSCVTISSANTSLEVPDSGRKHILKFDGNSNQYMFNDSLTTLKTLSLGESRRSSKASGIFKTRIYGSTSPDLFQRSNFSSPRKFVLAPPKLKSVAQTSWVAGGYWQVGVETPSLSRSSSQSSGFGSAGSNFGRSREPSISKDLDKCSVVSETQYCYASRPNSANSMNSCCQHVSPLINRCDSASFYSQPLTIIPNNSLYIKNSQSHFSPVQPEINSCLVDHCHSFHNQSFNTSIAQQNHPTNNHTNGYCCPTVLTSPVWLPLLLCGSLVFNIAVFCTILLR